MVINSKRFRGNYWTIAVCLVAIGGFLRFFLLTNQSLWWDEGFSVYNSDGSSFVELFFRVRTLLHADKFQPLYYWILFVIRQIFGDSETVLRGFSAVLGTLTLFIVYLTGVRFYEKQYALWSLGLITFSSLIILYSQEVRNYALILFLAALQLYVLSEAIVTPLKQRRHSRLVFSLLTSLGLFCSVQMSVFSASLCTSHFLLDRKWKQWFKWWMPAGVFCLPAVIYYMTLPGETNPGVVGVSRSDFPIFINIAFVVYGILVGLTYGPPQDELRADDKFNVLLNYLPELFILCFLGTAIACFLLIAFLREREQSKFKRSSLFFLCLLISCLIFGLLMALVTDINWVPRHSLFGWLPFSLLLPSAFCRPMLTKRRSGKIYKSAQLSVAALIALNVYSTYNYYFKPAYWRDDFRSTAQYLQSAQTDSSESVLLTGDPRLLKYYGDMRTLYSNVFVEKIKAGDQTWINDLKQITNASENITVIIYRSSWFNRKDVIAPLLDEYELVKEVNSFKGFKVLHLKAYESSSMSITVPRRG